MKSIGLYIPNLGGGGAERVVSRLSEILKEEYEVSIIINDNTVEYPVNCEIISLGVPAKRYTYQRLLLPIKRSIKLYSVKKQYKFDVVISFLTIANIVNILSGSKYSRVFLSVRNYTMLEKERDFVTDIVELFMKMLYNRAEYIIPVSKVLALSLNKDYGIPFEKMMVIYNPYDLHEINLLKNITIDNQEHNAFFNDSKVVLTIGRLSHQKGYWHLLKAFSLIGDKSVKLAIIGEGEDKNKIEKLIRDLSISDRVLLLGFQKNPFKYINKSYVYILSSLFEGFPNAMVEAMSCGCPIIATDCKSGPREILCKNEDLTRSSKDVEVVEYGILTPPVSDAESWSANIIEEEDRIMSHAITKVIEDEHLHHLLSQKGQKRASEFNYQICLSKYKKIIES